MRCEKQSMNLVALFVGVAAVIFAGASSRAEPIIPQVRTPHSISRAEFIENLERFYRMMDRKDHGYFTADDLMQPGYHFANPPVIYPLARVEVPFRCVDANRDGKVSHDEYIGYGARAFDATAKTGFIDPWGETMDALARAISSKTNCP